MWSRCQLTCVWLSKLCKSSSMGSITSVAILMLLTFAIQACYTRRCCYRAILYGISLRFNTDKLSGTGPTSCLWVNVSTACSDKKCGNWFGSTYGNLSLVLVHRNAMGDHCAQCCCNIQLRIYDVISIW